MLGTASNPQACFGCSSTTSSTCPIIIIGCRCHCSGSLSMKPHIPATSSYYRYFGGSLGAFDVNTRWPLPDLAAPPARPLEWTGCGQCTHFSSRRWDAERRCHGANDPASCSKKCVGRLALASATSSQNVPLFTWLPPRSTSE